MGNGVAEESFSERRSVALREASAEDDAFLYEVYFDTRREEMAAWGWPEAQQEMFARMQFNVRRQAYRMQFPAAEEKVVLFEGERVGSLIVERTSGGIRLVDIAVLSQLRGAGIGRAVIEGLFTEADAENKTVRLQVRRENDAARRLYERLGFAITNESELDFGMERLPGVASAISDASSSD